MTDETREFLLTPQEFDATQEKVRKLNDRAAKRGFSGVVELTAKSELVKDTSAAGLAVEHRMYRCTITCEAPKYEGWTFLAVFCQIFLSRMCKKTEPPARLNLSHMRSPASTSALC